MPNWIIELEPGVWLTEGEGDPPRTLVKANAVSWMNTLAAMKALNAAKAYHTFPNAKIVQA